MQDRVPAGVHERRGAEPTGAAAPASSPRGGRRRPRALVIGALGAGARRPLRVEVGDAGTSSAHLAQRRVRPLWSDRRRAARTVTYARDGRRRRGCRAASRAVSVVELRPIGPAEPAVQAVWTALAISSCPGGNAVEASPRLRRAASQPARLMPVGAGGTERLLTASGARRADRGRQRRSAASRGRRSSGGRAMAASSSRRASARPRGRWQRRPEAERGGGRASFPSAAASR